ncbi:proline/glycine betaine ABC transporter permease [Galactobacter sp.]|uniref:ABC transporter permease n=1 Tax=Galactobacter sp. TaxID=2676125 RepID=UPI0025C245F3|nr:proline/glycine betaine ABC transporter permease [Galactobacter sp.]
MNPEDLPTIPLSDWVDEAATWLQSAWQPFFDFINTVMEGAYDTVDAAFVAIPWWLMILVIVVIAWLSKKWILAAGTLIGLLVIVFLGYWEDAMHTLALVLVATIVALIVAIPLGIWAAKSRRVSAVVKPIMDFLQTMPAFVYLIPMVMFLATGVVPGIVATIFFSLAPGVRMTELGIRGVDSEVVEAGQAFGASPGRILRQIQLPLAMPTIMAGVNQVIMLALSMVVIAGMVGGEGLGQVVVNAVQNVRIGQGVSAGLCVVILAIILDRITGGFGSRQKQKKRQ